MRQAMSRAADAAATVADRVVGAGLKGLISGTHGAADGVRDGWRKGSQSVADRGRAWRGLRASSGESAVRPRECATDGATAGHSDSRHTDRMTMTSPGQPTAAWPTRCPRIAQAALIGGSQLALGVTGSACLFEFV